MSSDPKTLAGGILFVPGQGWGDGSHPTTQLCLQAVRLLLRGSGRGQTSFQVLDFGSGSGLLSIAAAKMGGRVHAVEIDAEGIRHADENARLNGVADLITQTRTIEVASESCDVVVANILRPILLEYAESLVRALKPGGYLILSGLVSTDLPEITVRFTDLLAAHVGKRCEPQIYRRAEWNAVVWDSK